MINFKKIVLLLVILLCFTGCSIMNNDINVIDKNVSGIINKNNIDLQKIQNSSSDETKFTSKVLDYYTYNGSEDLEHSIVSKEDGKLYGDMVDLFHFYAWNGSVFAASWAEGGFTNYYDNVTASSTLHSEGNINYDPANVIINYKNDRDITWAEGVDGDGIGEYIEITTRMNDCEPGPEDEDYTQQYTAIYILNGYTKDIDVWEKNNRVKSMKVYFNGKEIGIIELVDTIKPQRIDISSANIVSGVDINNIFKFEILEIYKGSKYDDTCISGIALSWKNEDF